MNLMNCHNCGTKLTGAPNLEHFLFCTTACKEAKETKYMEDREAEKATHSPWSRWSAETREEMKQALGITGAWRWTEQAIAQAAVETGDVPMIRADGEADGRSKGNRKCGKCGENGHNARTCGAKDIRKAQTAALAASMAREPRVTVAEPMSHTPAESGEEEPTGEVSTLTQETAGNVPVPRLLSERLAPQRGAVAGSGPKLKTCGKCGGKGHNARTCGKPVLAIGSSATKASPSGAKGSYICGKCGNSGHNARTCKS